MGRREWGVGSGAYNFEAGETFVSVNSLEAIGDALVKFGVSL